MSFLFLPRRFNTARWLAGAHVHLNFLLIDKRCSSASSSPLTVDRAPSARLQMGPLHGRSPTLAVVIALFFNSAWRISSGKGVDFNLVEAEAPPGRRESHRTPLVSCRHAFWCTRLGRIDELVSGERAVGRKGVASSEDYFADHCGWRSPCFVGDLCWPDDDLESSDKLIGVSASMG